MKAEIQEFLTGRYFKMRDLLMELETANKKFSSSGGSGSSNNNANASSSSSNVTVINRASVSVTANNKSSKIPRMRRSLNASSSISSTASSAQQNAEVAASSSNLVKGQVTTADEAAVVATLEQRLREAELRCQVGSVATLFA